MHLIHTSPTEITEINSVGRFGGFLWFSDHEYVMSVGDYVVYTIDVDDSEIIRAKHLFYHDDADVLDGLVKQVIALVGCDHDTAQSLIDQTASIYTIDCEIDPEDIADVDWDIQHITGQAALSLGFRGASMQDEQGTAYLIYMMGYESKLTIGNT